MRPLRDILRRMAMAALLAMSFACEVKYLFFADCPHCAPCTCPPCFEKAPGDARLRCNEQGLVSGRVELRDGEYLELKGVSVHDFSHTPFIPVVKEMPSASE